MRILIDLNSRTPNPLTNILTPSLFDYVNKITFPWPLTSTLSGSKVGHVFFGSQGASSKEWSTPLITSSLTALSKIPLSEIFLDDIIDLLPDPSEADFYYSITGLVVFLDQGPRYRCKGVNARYIYEFFDVISRAVVVWLTELEEEDNPFTFRAWTRVGIARDQAIVRICMLIAPLVHSEVVTDMDLHLDIEERLRVDLETSSGLKDPHRDTFKSDVTDSFLMIEKVMREGPPKGENVLIEEFVWWIFWYFTTHVGIVERFGRSPWRNVSVGRDDTEDEMIWLGQLGMERGDEDESVRKVLKEDLRKGRWRKLRL